MSNPLIIGLTGPSGSGKSLITNMIDNNNIFIINADKISHHLLKQNINIHQKIINYFPNNILNNDKLIDRKKLGNIVFSDKNKLYLLNQIMFPYIKNEIYSIINSCNKNYKIILLDAPTLIESNLYKICDKVIVVIAKIDIRIKRIINRDNLTIEEANNRLSSQLSDSEYIKKADFVIYNNQDLLYLKKNIDKIINKLLNKFL